MENIFTKVIYTIFEKSPTENKSASFSTRSSTRTDVVMQAWLDHYVWYFILICDVLLHEY